MADEKDYQSLLGFYKTFKDNNENLKKKGIHDYSLINSLLKANDEVRLHSKFIYSMINPEGLHYCGTGFLETFLESIACKEFINLNKAVVYREKDNIDLLIHDYNHFIIIENKLDACDQPQQITRYIKYVKDNFLSDSDDLSELVKVVYLSKNKKRPSKGSIVGFDLDQGKLLKWKGLTEEEQKRINGFSLDGSEIPFIHMAYFNTSNNICNIETWVKNSKKWLLDIDNNKEISLTYAFNEYKLILKRLNKNKGWKNIMSLSDFALDEMEKGDKDIYSFMFEAKKELSKTQAEMIIKVVDELLLDPDSELDLTKSNIKKWSVSDCKKWIDKEGLRGNWINIGFDVTINDTEYRFCLATQYVYFGENGQENYFKENNRLLEREVLLGDSTGIEILESKLKEKIRQFKSR